MTRTDLAMLLAALALAAAPSMATSAPANACDTLPEADAVKLLGAPLPETARSQVKPAEENGNDRQSSCGRFPKGYKLESAQAPPERGILVELHSLPSADAARRFYEGVLDMQTQLASATAGAGIVKVGGLGDGAYLQPTVLPSSMVKIVTLTFRKGSTVASVQVWNSVGTVDAVARSAAAQVAAKLP